MGFKDKEFVEAVDTVVKYLKNIQKYKDKCSANVRYCEEVRCDFNHIKELIHSDAVERSQIFKEERQNLLKRREYKDEFMLSTEIQKIIVDYEERVKQLSLCSLLEDISKTCKNINDGLNKRKYSPRSNNQLAIDILYRYPEIVGDESLERNIATSHNVKMLDKKGKPKNKKYKKTRMEELFDQIERGGKYGSCK